MRRLRSTRDELTVGLVHWALPPTIGGVESHLADYVRLLAARGVRVIVFSGEKNPSAEIAKIAGRVEFRYQERLHLAGCGAPPADGRECIDDLTLWFKNELAEFDVDVVHGHNLHYFSSAPASALNEACRSRGVPRHHTYHNYWDDTHFADLVATWEGHWSNSDYVANLCAEGYQGDPPITHYLGIDPDRFACTRKPFENRVPKKATRYDQVPVILQPARLLPWKGPIQSVKMLRLLHADGYRVRLVLTDTKDLIDWDDERRALRAELNALINKLGLSEWVEFKDKVYYGDMPSLYNEADIVINPSHGEPLGLVALEAMAASRPVVVTDSGGMTETFAERAGAVVVDDGKLHEHLFEAVRGFLRNPRYAVRAGRRGRRHVVKNFHMDPYVDAMIKEYQASRSSADRA
jgi:glycosyltransferase involved in cell wall biosynthesis